MAGAFQIARDIFGNPIWQNVTEFRLFFLIVGNAIFSDEGKEIAGIQLQRGQWLRSYRNLQSDLEYLDHHTVKRPGIATIKRAIDNLVADERIIIEVTEHGTLFTVLNYAKYQDLSNYKTRDAEQMRNSSGTVAEQMRNNNNNVNKDKNVNNDINNTLFPEEEISPDNQDQKPKIPFDEIISYLNQKASTNYRSNSKATQEHIRARFRDGYRLPDFIVVIDKKCIEWLGTENEKYLRPETLFGTKFEGYLNQKGGKNNGQLQNGSRQPLYDEKERENPNAWLPKSSRNV